MIKPWFYRLVLATWLAGCGGPVLSTHNGAAALSGAASAFGAAAEPPLDPPGGADTSALPPLAVDGDLATGWKSQTGGYAWLRIDLGRATALATAVVDWQDEFASTYSLAGSTDGQAWRDLATVDAANGGHDVVPLSGPAVRYVRLACRVPRTANGRFGVAGLALYAADQANRDLALRRPVAVSGTFATPLTEAQVAEAMAAREAADRAYRAGGFAEAYRSYQDLNRRLGEPLRAARLGEYLRLRTHLLAAAFRREHPQATGKKHRKLLYLIVPTTDAVAKIHMSDPAPTVFKLRVNEDAVKRIRDGCFWYAESMLAVTGGQVGWQVEEKRLDEHHIARFTWYDEKGDLHPFLQPENVEPDLRPMLDDRAYCDGFVTLGPGTPGISPYIPQGGSGEITVHPRGKPPSLRFHIVASSGDQEPFYTGEEWLHHELYHRVENIYHALPYPKTLHWWGDRSAWPADFTGLGEWDFLEQTYRRYVMPTDRFAAFEWASGRYLPLEATLKPACAIDGKPETRWSSRFEDPQWLEVDLGRIQTIDRVTLSWEQAAGETYEIQVAAPDGWRTVARMEKGDGGMDELTFTPVQARTLRMMGTRRTTPYGYSIWEFGVYGPATAGKNLALGGRARASSQYGQ